MKDRKIIYVDVGNMPKKEAIKYLNEARVDLGLGPIVNDYLFMPLVIVAFTLQFLLILAEAYYA